MRKFSAQQLRKVQHELKPKVAHFKHTKVGPGMAELETEPLLFVFTTPVTEIELSVTVDFTFRIVNLGSDEADYSFYDLSLRFEPLETEYDDYMTYYEKMELEKELPSFEDFFKKAQSASLPNDLVGPRTSAGSVEPFTLALWRQRDATKQASPNHARHWAQRQR